MDLSTPEIQRIALVVGAFTASHYKESKGVIAGGMIVPGFLVILLFLSPLWCLAVVASAYGIFAIYSRFLKRIDYQRRTPMYLLSFLSLLLTYPLALLAMQLGLLPTALDSLSGTMIPAVIAFTFTRQGVGRVSRAMAVTAAITISLTALILLVGQGVGADFNYLHHYYPLGEGLHLQGRLIQFLVCLLLGYFIYRRTQMRPGGYMVAPIAAGLLLQPLSAVLFSAGCVFVYLAMALLTRFSLIIGLKRYVFGLLYSVVYVWAIELLFIRLGLQQLPFQGNHLLVIIAMMSYANDALLHRLDRVAGWMLALIAAMAICLVLTKTITI